MVRPDFDRSPATSKLVLPKDRIPYYYNPDNVVIVAPDADVKSFKINGKEYDDGIVLNMRMQFICGDFGSAMYNLKGQYDKLSFIVGALDNNVNAEQGKGYLTIQADGRTIWQKDLSQLDMAEQVVLDVNGVERLSFHSSQDKWNLSAAFADITAWPKGQGPEVGSSSVAASSDLKSLPDVVPLMSTIEPFTVLGGLNRDQMLYTGKSDHIAFNSKELKRANKIVGQCDKVIDTHLKNLQAEYAQLRWLLDNAINVDGRNSDEKVVFTPLAPGETVPADAELQLVETFR